VKKRRRLASIEAAIATIAAPPPRSQPPLVEAPRCTSDPTCIELRRKPCWYCQRWLEANTFID
jgi:hypothetical protein